MIYNKRLTILTKHLTNYHSHSLRPLIQRNKIITSLDKFFNTKHKKIYYNLDYGAIQSMYSKVNEVVSLNTDNGLVNMIDTGIFTGRSPNDKYFIDSKQLIDTSANNYIEKSIYEELFKKSISHIDSLDKLYIFDGYCGHRSSKIKVRFITEYLWQHHFVKNMFIENNHVNNYTDFQPDFTIINACNVINDNWKEHDLNSENFIILNLDKNIGLIGGTHYGGEMKKGIFTVMNYLLPQSNVLPMHCSANIGKDGDVALFFGLSGTGKTSLSTTNDRQLIGDDEHGWDEHGIFNFEGGCYAKTIGLNKENEPEIYNAIKGNALLENIYYNEDNIADFDNSSKTQNGRVSYGLENIDNYFKPQKAGHPNHIIFLTCDAFGVLPPISQLTKEQAIYHFLSGYTAKVAGTERGIKEPVATFSSCFGAAFLPLKPEIYAELLANKIDKHNPNIWLVNTGWTGGSYGVGHRIPIEISRACVKAILGNEFHSFSNYPYFDLKIPESIDTINSDILNPENMWDNKEEFKQTVNKLQQLFRENRE